MGTIASQITSITIVYSTVYLDADQRKYQSSASLAFVRGIHRRPVNSPHKWPVTREKFPFDDVIMETFASYVSGCPKIVVFICERASKRNHTDTADFRCRLGKKESKKKKLRKYITALPCCRTTVAISVFLNGHCLMKTRVSSFEDVPAINTLRPRQNGRRFADDTFRRIFLNDNVRISIKISLKFVPKGPINNNPALVQIMAWRRSGDNPLSEPVMVSLLTHICVTRPQWFNTYGDNKFVKLLNYCIIL